MSRIHCILYLCILVVGLCKGQKNDGDSCVDDYTNAVGRCTPADKCQSAKVDFQQNGIRPTFCEYNAFGNSLVCCRDGSTILQAPDRNAALLLLPSMLSSLVK